MIRGAVWIAADGDPGGLDEGGAAKVTDESELAVRAGNAGAELLLVETRDVPPRT